MPNHVHLIAVPDAEDSLSKALGRTHSEYALTLNRAAGRSGHLWQNRFFSCPLDRDHLAQTLTYVELNPVRAGLVAETWQWAWSSAAGRVCESGDGGLLGAGLSDEDLDRIRRATRVGEPLGSKNFIMDLERRAGRVLRVRERGRPRKVGLDGGGIQEGIFFGE
jgi:putative transposase